MSHEECVLCGLPHNLCRCFGVEVESGTWCLVSGVSDDGIGTVVSTHSSWDDAIGEREYDQELWFRFDSPAVGDQVCRV